MMYNESKVAGHLKGTECQLDFEWEIPDFLSLPAEVNEKYNSPVYFFCDSSWYLQLYPNGEKEYSSEGYIGLYLMRGDSGAPMSVTYSLFLKKTDGRKTIENETKDTFETKDSGWGVSEAIRRSEVIKSESEFLPSGVLTVICCLKFAEIQKVNAEEVLRRAMKDWIPRADASTETEVDVGTQKLLSDLEGLIVGGDESDVTVQVQDEEFKLHRVILAARTPVFNSMFTLNMKEKATGVVSIDDCEAGPFRTFVHYLYTGSTDQISSENVFSLYAIADKYQVLELKMSCLNIIEDLLSVDTFCNVVDLAMKYEVEHLRAVATDFLAKNTVDIIGTQQWQTLLRKNLIEVNDLLMNALILKECYHSGQ